MLFLSPKVLYKDVQKSAVRVDEIKMSWISGNNDYNDYKEVFVPGSLS